MKKLNFLDQAGIAFALALGSLPLWIVVTFVSPSGSWLISASIIQLVYAGMILMQRTNRAGSAMLSVMLLGAITVLVYAGPPKALSLIALGAMSWTARRSLVSTTTFSAIIDGLLTFGAAVTAYWIERQLGLLPITVWTFYLVQAASGLFVFESETPRVHSKDSRYSFGQSADAAEIALKAIYQRN